MTNLEKLHRDYDDALGDPNAGPNERLEYARDYIGGLRDEVARLRRFENIVRERARIDERGKVGNFCRGVLLALDAQPAKP